VSSFTVTPELGHEIDLWEKASDKGRAMVDQWEEEDD